MNIAGDDDRSLLVAQCQNPGQGFVVLCNVDDVELETLPGQGAVGCIALDAIGLAVDGDSHDHTFRCRDELLRYDSKERFSEGHHEEQALRFGNKPRIAQKLKLQMMFVFYPPR